jgi:hypothetical protein
MRFRKTPMGRQAPQAKFPEVILPEVTTLCPLL